MENVYVLYITFPMLCICFVVQLWVENPCGCRSFAYEIRYNTNNMIIIYSIREKIYFEEEFVQEYDPVTEGSGIAMAVMQRCISCMWIPIHGSRAYVKAVSMASGQQIPVLMWTDDMKARAEEMIPRARYTWRYRLFLPLFLLAIGILVGWGVLSGIQRNSTLKQQTEYRQQPQVGDIILARVMISWYTDQSTPSDLRVFKIEGVNGDSLIVRRGIRSVDTMELYRKKDRAKIMALFEMSNDAFSPEQEVYSLSKYRNGEERFARIDREILTDKEKEEEEALRRKTDIIEPEYIMRPKK